MKKKVIIWVGAIVSVLILIPLVVFIVLSYQHGSIEPIETEIGKFKPDSSWQLVSEDFQPPRTICLDGNCPSAQRVWHSRVAMSNDVLNSMLKGAGWSTSDDICRNKQTVEDYSCFATIDDGEYTVQISTNTKQSKTIETEMIVNVWKRAQ